MKFYVLNILKYIFRIQYREQLLIEKKFTNAKMRMCAAWERERERDTSAEGSAQQELWLFYIYVRTKRKEQTLEETHTHCSLATGAKATWRHVGKMHLFWMHRVQSSSKGNGPQ